MSAIPPAIAHGSAAGLLDAAERRWAALLARCLRAARLRSDVERLRELDDHLLADMGIARDQIEHLLAHGRDR